MIKLDGKNEDGSPKVEIVETRVGYSFGKQDLYVNKKYGARLLRFELRLRKTQLGKSDFCEARLSF